MDWSRLFYLWKWVQLWVAAYSLGWVVLIGTTGSWVLSCPAGWEGQTLLVTISGLKDTREALSTQGPFQWPRSRGRTWPGLINFQLDSSWNWFTINVMSLHYCVFNLIKQIITPKSFYRTLDQLVYKNPNTNLCYLVFNYR